jgi:hypothetical protein
MTNRVEGGLGRRSRPKDRTGGRAMQKESDDDDRTGREDATYRDQDINYLSSYCLHVDNMLMQRVNFFLVAESMLLVGYATLLSNTQMPHVNNLSIARVIAWFGLIITAIWIYTSYFSYDYLKKLRKKSDDYLKIYSTFRKGWQHGKVSINGPMVYATPFVAIVVWMILLYKA